MKKDRLREDRDNIHNLDDLIEARNPGTSHIGEDSDSLSNDFDIPEDTDVEDALTFPHPHHHKKPDKIELIDTLDEENMDEDWEDQDLLPSDYAHGYNEAITTDIRDEADEVVEDMVHAMDHLSLDQTSQKNPIETMPDRFTPDEEE